MQTNIKNGNSGDVMKVDPNGQGHVFAITEDEARQATDKGNEYNLNTGLIALTGTTASAIAYFKNDEDAPFIITGVAWYVGTRSGTPTDTTILTLIRNPTTGTIFNATPDDGDMNSNTNFGSNKTLKSTTLFYKGTDGDTFTNGSDHAILGAGEGRSFATVNVELPKGSGVGVKIDINTDGGANVYLAFIGYVKDPNNTPA